MVLMSDVDALIGIYDCGSYIQVNEYIISKAHAVIVKRGLKGRHDLFGEPIYGASEKTFETVTSEQFLKAVDINTLDESIKDQLIKLFMEHL